jgi:hypothetical protein
MRDDEMSQIEFVFSSSSSSFFLSFFIFSFVFLSFRFPLFLPSFPSLKVPPCFPPFVVEKKRRTEKKTEMN